MEAVSGKTGDLFQIGDRVKGFVDPLQFPSTPEPPGRCLSLIREPFVEQEAVPFLLSIMSRNRE
jgi:hypothetical protein